MTSLNRQEKDEVFIRRFSVGDMLIRVSVVRSRFECDSADEELAAMNGRYVYSVELVNETKGENAYAPKLTFSQRYAEGFAVFCAEGMVTPVTFGDIVEDML